MTTRHPNDPAASTRRVMQCVKCGDRHTVDLATIEDWPVDPRVAEAFDLLGGMWSWSEENGYLATGTSWPLQAGRVLREVVGRPARAPESKE